MRLTREQGGIYSRDRNNTAMESNIYEEIFDMYRHNRSYYWKSKNGILRHISRNISRTIGFGQRFK